MEKPKEKDSSGLTRRGFLNSLTAASIFGLPANANEPEPKDNKETTVIESLSTDFIGYEEAVEEWVPFYEREIPHMLAFGGLITNNDPEHRTRLEYLREALKLSDFTPQAAELIRHYLPAQAFVESGLDAAKESEDGAKGVLQFMPNTWEEHASSPDANILSLVEQVVATDSLLEQIRATFANRCNDELDIIKEVFFAGEEDTFINDFYVPCILCGFFAGAGTMTEVIKNFAHRYPSSSQLQEVYDQGIVSYGKNTFMFMAFLAKRLSSHQFFGSEASLYVVKIMAAREALDRNLTEEERLVLLGPADIKFDTREQVT